MPLNIPGVDRITKDDPRTGEALQAVKSFVNAGVTQPVGTFIPAPPSTSTPPVSQTPTTPNTGTNPVVTAPPNSGFPRPGNET